MIRKSLNAIAVASLVFMACACNSKSDDEIITYSSANTIISSVQLSTSNKNYKGVDSVFFSIDLVEARIFNADSLPYGTPKNCFVPNITTSSASAVELHVPRKNQTDTIIDYLKHSTDSVDFSNGPVKIKVVAADGISSRVYTMDLNVHQVKSDTLVWSRAQQSNLPSSFAIPQHQGTAATASAIYCLTSYEGKYCISKASDPAFSWVNSTPSFSFVPQVESLSATDDKLFVLATDGTLYESADGISWKSTTNKWDNIYGNYGTELWGSVKTDGKWYRVSYPTGKREAIQENFPVSNSSQTINFEFDLSLRPQMIMTGGVLASGQYSADTWGYDGGTWARISSTPLPAGLKDAVVVPYFVSRFNSANYKTTRRSALLAMFGQRQDGTLNDTVYVSLDFGLNWKKAGQELQFSKSFPARYAARGFVYDEIVKSRSAEGNMLSWRELGTPRLPLGAILEGIRNSRATAPITEWECPYIYIFGGVNNDGVTYNTLWRGVISRFTFKPLY